MNEEFEEQNILHHLTTNIAAAVIFYSKCVFHYIINDAESILSHALRIIKSAMKPRLNSQQVQIMTETDKLLEINY